ncbi:hypothetical protein M9H77_26893 [Catharanthus roseus]|uniref:Uncharacterized protein n=1 Tax=Catharanthus roseus TaxID=4058 RepID=A0ACC0ACU9_CATRO|nr:hypothetical protein M9H77_26893 [Catharanthus roseus]
MLGAYRTGSPDGGFLEKYYKGKETYSITATAWTNGQGDEKLQGPITKARTRRIKEKDDQVAHRLMIAIEETMKEGLKFKNEGLKDYGNLPKLLMGLLEDREYSSPIKGKRSLGSLIEGFDLSTTRSYHLVSEKPSQSAQFMKLNGIKLKAPDHRKRQKKQGIQDPEPTVEVLGRGVDWEDPRVPNLILIPNLSYYIIVIVLEQGLLHKRLLGLIKSIEAQLHTHYNEGTSGSDTMSMDGHLPPPPHHEGTNDLTRMNLD